MLSREFAERFARDWIEAWNAHDLARVLAHYDDGFTMSSPFIALLGAEASGTLTGKDAVAAYWRAALDKIPDLRFTLIDTAVGADSVAVYYHAVLGKKAVEVFFFNGAGKVVRACAHYDAL